MGFIEHGPCIGAVTDQSISPQGQPLAAVVVLVVGEPLHLAGTADRIRSLCLSFLAYRIPDRDLDPLSLFKHKRLKRLQYAVLVNGLDLLDHA